MCSQIKAQRCSVSGGDVAIANVPPDYSRVLGLQQAVIVGMARPRFGLFHQQFVRQARNGVINEFTSRCQSGSPLCGKEN
jgi:hypothetical protein